jgi:hypothetical protein
MSGHGRADPAAARPVIIVTSLFIAVVSLTAFIQGIIGFGHMPEYSGAFNFYRNMQILMLTSGAAIFTYFSAVAIRNILATLATLAPQLDVNPHHHNVEFIDARSSRSLNTPSWPTSPDPASSTICEKVA